VSELVVQLDSRDIARIEAAMKAAGVRAHDGIRRALNWTGDRAKTKVVGALTAQTGLRRGTILRAVKPTRANFTSLIYRMRARGGDVSLKYFGARETQAGVSAAPWGARRVYAGTFMRGGRFPNRVNIPSFHGQVFARTAGARLPIAKQKSGLFIPEEMVKGDTARTFEMAVSALLPGRVEHEVGAILSGVA